MSEFIRLNRYPALLSGRRAVSLQELCQALEISRATCKRDIAKLRDQAHAPIRYDRDRGGYVLDAPADGSTELPGLWFSPEEVLALVTIQRLLAQLAPGLLGPRLKPLQARLEQLMAANGLAGADVARRIRLLQAGVRSPQPQHFEQVAAGTLARRQLRITHFHRERGERSQRSVSPQRLVHWRDNWYLDAWCHWRDGLRRFSLDALEAVQPLDAPATEVDEAALDAELGAGYGIFAGVPTAVAVLRFSPERARWVRGETWHPRQQGREEADGSYVLEVPYGDDREILGEILRYGAEVRVVGPEGLRRRVQRALLEAAGGYV